MEQLNQHKVAIVIVAGVGIGLYLLTSKSGATSASGSSGSSSTGSGSATGGYTSALNQQYQNQLMSQALSNQAQLQSEAVAGATQIGLSQQQTARQGQNLMALAYTGNVIGSTLQNQNNNQAGLYASEAGNLAGQGSVGLGQIGNVNMSTNNEIGGSGGSFSGFGMNISGHGVP